MKKYIVKWYTNSRLPETYMGEDIIERETLEAAIMWADDHSGGFDYNVLEEDEPEEDNKMKKYLVSITTHMASGRQIDAWPGDWVEAYSPEEAIREAQRWEASLLKADGAIRIETVGNAIYYEAGYEYYKEFHAHTEEDMM